MRTLSTAGFEKPRSVCMGAAPILRWLPIADLVLDPAYQPPIGSRGRRNVNRIAASFSWSCFCPVIVAPVAGGKFAIIDGHHRTTAAALVGIESVPCQIVTASREEQAVACKAINGNVVSRMALHADGLESNENLAVQLSDICARAEVELLRYPVPVDRQSAGQTMAIGAFEQCLKRYDEETLISALHCVTQTTNNRPGMLSARMIKALCAVLHSDKKRRDSGLALLEAFDAIDLAAIAKTAIADAAGKKVSPVQALTDLIRSELVKHFICNEPCSLQPAHSGRKLDVRAATALEFRGNPGVKRLRSQPSPRQRG
jgi:hypothetical protein